MSRVTRDPFLPSPSLRPAGSRFKRNARVRLAAPLDAFGLSAGSLGHVSRPDGGGDWAGVRFDADPRVERRVLADLLAPA